MLTQAGAASTDLRAVAVALGPGSFTGLRVALAAAKGLALAGDLALLGVPTLDPVAYPHSRQPLPVIALVQAGRGRVCWAPYAHGPVGWAASASYGLATIDAVALISRNTLIAGELAPGDRKQLVALTAGRAVFVAGPPGSLPGCLARSPGVATRPGARRCGIAQTIYLHHHPDNLFPVAPMTLTGLDEVSLSTALLQGSVDAHVRGGSPATPWQPTWCCGRLLEAAGDEARFIPAGLCWPLAPAG
jgi:tRNA threonylcarbamoyladenosine biosynthesis protein TsaB